MKPRIGIMQGRLVKREIKSRLQSFPWKNWIKEINLLKELNINNFEWTIDYKKFDSNPLIKRPLKVLQIIKKKKLILNSITADFFMQKPPFKKNPKTTKYLLKLINILNKMEINYLIIPLVDNSSVKDYKYRNFIINYFNNISDKIQIKKLKILFEFDLSPKKIINFMRQLSKHYGINYDTGNSSYYGYNFSEEKKYFSKVYNIHIKDRNKYGNSVKLGNGLVNFEKFFKYLKKIKYTRNLILQTYISKNNNVANETLRNYKFIQSFYEKKK